MTLARFIRKPRGTLSLSFSHKPAQYCSMAIQTLTSSSPSANDAVNEGGVDEDVLCVEQEEPPEEALAVGRPNGYLSGESRIERAWAHWKKIGQPKFILAPMVDNSELPFRMLCRKYGAEAAYTPMLHARVFTESKKYRSQEFTTCKVSLCTHLMSSAAFEFVVLLVHILMWFEIICIFFLRMKMVEIDRRTVPFLCNLVPMIQIYCWKLPEG